MSNLNFSAFYDRVQNDYANKDIAEAYMQMYPYAAEDFTSQPDVDTYIKAVTAWMTSVDKRLTQQMNLISNHVHIVPVHTHPKAGPSTPFPTKVPNNSSAIKWAATQYPKYINTSLTKPNMVGNFVVTNLASEGSIEPKLRRALPVPITLRPMLSPTLQNLLTPGVL